MYEKALAIDPNFIASHIGIGNDYLAMGKPDKARTAFAKIAAVARNTGEKRTAHFWMAASYVHEGATDKALEELRAGYSLAQAEQDAGSMSGDLTQMGDVLREAGRPADALAKYREAVTVIDKSQVPEEVKQATRRTHVFEEGRVAVAGNDIATAKKSLAEYTRQVAEKNRPFEVRQQHELAGLIALAERDYSTATRELQLANQQDPRVLYALALAWKGAGEAGKATKFATKAANFNGLNFNYAYVRGKARKITGT
jgi:tetratricopeptide (TPR) repeat protein